MKLTFGTDTLDIEATESPSDILSFVQSITGQKKSTLVGRDYKPTKDYILFDECTEKETALRNLVFALEIEQAKLNKKVFPPAVSNMLVMARQTGDEKLINIPPVSTEEFRLLQKITFFKLLVSQYTSLLIQSRVGFGLSLLVTNNGQIYTLQDTRKLFTQNI